MKKKFASVMCGSLLGCLLSMHGYAAGATVTVGGANFSEQTVLANIYASVLRLHGVDAQVRLNLGNRQIISKALETGDVDVVPEYIGSLLSFYDPDTTLTDENSITTELKAKLPSDLQLLDSSVAGSTTAWAVTKKTAEKYKLVTLSDLASVSKGLVLGGPPEVTTAALGLPGLKKIYGIDFKSVKSLDMGGPLSRLALNSNAIDVATVVSTQGVLAKEDWVVLQDDRHQQPPQNITPLIRKPVINDKVVQALNSVSARLNNDELKALNRLVEIEHKDPAKVADQWVKERVSFVVN